LRAPELVLALLILPLVGGTAFAGPDTLAAPGRLAAPNPLASPNGEKSETAPPLVKVPAPTLESLKQRSPEKRWSTLKKLTNSITKRLKKSSADGPVAKHGQASQQPEASEAEPKKLISSASRSVTIIPVIPAVAPASGGTSGNKPIEIPPAPIPEMTPGSKYGAAGPGSSGLRKITDISPYYDYEPDPEIARDDPCRFLCPRPDGFPCDQQDPGTPALQCPEEVVLSEDPYERRFFGESVLVWQASNLWYNPLYFEDAPLERYGHTYHHALQPFASVAKFGKQLIGLPYQMSLDPIRKRTYTLGWYRPGECAPKLHYQIPLNARAAATQVGVTNGMILLFP